MTHRYFSTQVVALFAALASGILLGQVLTTQAATPIGNESQEEYRAPWPQGVSFARRDGCPIQAPTNIGCTGHLAGTANEFAVDMHNQTASDCGTALRAVRQGSVTFFDANQGQGYGNLIRINHIAFNGGQTSSWYAHLSDPTSAAWDSVFIQRDFLGRMGTTGNSTGCHLHFQLDLGFGSPLVGAQTSNLVLSGTPGVDGFDLFTFSGNPYPASPDFRSNNTGAGYGRPNAPANMDPGPEDAPLRIPIRNYAKILAYYAIDYGSTKASPRGVCGSNRRWVKSCTFGSWGTFYAQGFIATGLYGQIPRAIVESQVSPGAFSIDAQYWKAYGRVCTISGTTKKAYEWLGRPTSEDYPLVQNNDIQTFEGGVLVKDFSNPASITMTVSVDGAGACIFHDVLDVLDVNNDPCLDVNVDGVVGASDLAAVAMTSPVPRFGSFEGSPYYNDRYDVNRDGAINSIDIALVAQDFGHVCR